MTARNWPVGVLALGLVLAACESQTPVAVQQDEAFTPAFDHIPAAPFAPTLADEGVLWVCKDGPVGTYTFTATTNNPSVITLLGSPFDITVVSPTATVCRQTATSDGRGLTSPTPAVTVTETGLAPNTAFNAVDVYYYLPSNDVMTLRYHERFYSPTFVVNANPPGTIGNGFSDDLGVIVVYRNVPVTGCTLTQGYWKTHNASFWGGAPEDPTWNLITPSAELSPFFLSGQTWFDVFWTAPAGNAFYILAHQYMAARLNQLRPASVPSSVQTALNAATALFSAWTPAQIDPLKGNDVLRKQFVTLAGILAAYNEGLTGPGHCGGD